jgi:hypothetical protein
MGLFVEAGGEIHTPVTKALYLAPLCGAVSTGPIRPANFSLVGPFPPYPVELRLVSQKRMAVGFTYNVSIEITNKSGSTLTFEGSCPTATMEIASGKPGEWDYDYRERQSAPLDCSSWGSIEPGGTVSIPYTVSIPTDLPYPWEAWGLSWYVGDGSDQRAGLFGLVSGFLPPPNTASTSSNIIGADQERGSVQLPA